MRAADQTSLRPSVFERHVCSLDVPGFNQALVERGHNRCKGPGEAGAEEADHRHRFCCAREPAGHARAAPPSVRINSRRLIALLQAGVAVAGRRSAAYILYEIGTQTDIGRR